MAKLKKTNAMRQLDQLKVPYQWHEYAAAQALDGIAVAQILGQEVEHVFKTLVTVGKSGQHYVFVIPVALTLDLKQAAHAVGEKSITMIKEKELLPLTGYVHGGCSPIGMKKQFPTVIAVQAESLPIMMVSGGKIGLQLALSPRDLQQTVKAEFKKLT